jgi:hypothetical protein
MVGRTQAHGQTELAQRASPRSCSRLPVIIPGQIDVFPAQRQQVSDQLAEDYLPTLTQRFDGAFQVDRVPVIRLLDRPTEA